MPEIKHVFNQGKMNKDLDERLVQNGQYRDAMNIQVSTSDGSDIGAVQNILGNTNIFSSNIVPPGAKCVGAVASEKDNSFYWFVYSNFKNLILKYRNGQVTFVFVDLNGVLNFTNKIITGINIIDDFLLWTDGLYEPKKINIQRCIDGTDQDGYYHTKLVASKRYITASNCIEVKPEHITVIKQSPKTKLKINAKFDKNVRANTSFDFSSVEVGDTQQIYFTNFPQDTAGYQVGDIVLVKTDSGETAARLRITEILMLSDGSYMFELLSKNVDLTGSLLSYSTEIEDISDLFDRKFVRFGYRYKYQDGEYSSFSPFTDVVFRPDLFEYSATDAYNKAMENNLISLKLRNFITNDTPQDVVQVDILYKESTSPVVYIVDKLKWTDPRNLITPFLGNGSNSNYMEANFYEITSDLIFAVVPQNQLLRTYDNVPRTAQAQELTGNRIVYGNYLQNYDVIEKPTLIAKYVSRFQDNTSYENDYFQDLTDLPTPRPKTTQHLFGQKSLKSLRNYQLGISYLDDYNRETPIFTGAESIFNIPKKFADNKLKIQGQVTNFSPSWAKSFKVYVKETSTEYYNISMSRSYKAEDGNVWLAFPSSERNKVDDETFLILKKAIDNDNLVESEAKYKILAIENEAPPSIATEQVSIFEKSISAAPTDIFGIYGPTVNSKSLRITTSSWNTGGAQELDTITEDLVFYIKNTLTNEYTKTYDIRSVSSEGSYYRMTLDTVFETQDAELIYPNYPTTTSGGVLDVGSNLKIIVSKVKNIADSTQFKGMFFVKINNDEIIEDNVLLSQGSNDYEIVNTMPTHYFADAYSFPTFTGGSTGHFRSTHDGHWRSLLGRFGGTSNPLFSAKTDPDNDFSGNVIGGFFIDKAWYAGVQPGGGCANDAPTSHPGHVFASVKALITLWKEETEQILSTTLPDPLQGEGTGVGGFFGSFQFRRQCIFFVWNWFHQTRGDQYSGYNPGQDLPAMGTSGSTWPVGGGGDIFKNNMGLPSNITYKYKPDFGGGIYEENGEHYVEVAFSEIGERTNTGDPKANNSNGVYGDDDLRYGSFNNTGAFDIRYNAGAQANYAKDYSATDDELKLIALNMAVGKRFKVKSDDDINNIYKITGVQRIRRYNHVPFIEVQNAYTVWMENGGNSNEVAFEQLWDDFGTPHNRRYVFKLKLDHSLEDVRINNKAITHADNIGKEKSVSFQFIEPRYNTSTRQKISDNPAVWETEPKETADLDIYYEASEILPLSIDHKTNSSFIPVGSVVTCPERPTTTSGLTYVVAWNDNKVTFNVPIDLNEYLPPGQSSVRLYFTRPDSSYTSASLDVTATLADTTLGNTTYIVNRFVGRNPFALSWFNCFSFGNGVESNRIRDDFNQPIIDKGVKVNTILEENYEEEKRSSGLIYSGIYNTNSGVNNLNQFIQAEKITKDLNPDYGSIQKLYSRSTADGDLIALCEDRVIKILANKDALFNADGNANLTSTNNVLGQAIPYSGEFGISNNPESFAADNYRAYFTDKQRGAVLRLSMDGLTPISQYGMSDFFKNSLLNVNKLIGSFDDKKEEYNLTIPTSNTTVSFKESVNGWSSFKSFVPEAAVSLGNDYFTFRLGLPYKHHALTDISGNDVARNTFYGDHTPSSVSVLLNDSPSVIKSYKNLGYEGSQSKVVKDTTNVNTGYYNLEEKHGWSATTIKTDKQEGKVNEFIEKEGKWFNYIRGTNFDEVVNLRTKEFSFQGIGEASDITFDVSLYPPISGCTDPRASNYNPLATVDDNSCFMAPPNNTTLVGGCTDPNAPNYDANADYDNGSCQFICDIIPGCTDPTALNYNPDANQDNGTCILPVYGCTSSTAQNYDPNANIDDGSCLYAIGGGSGGGLGSGSGGNSGGGTGSGGNTLIYGCTDPLAENYDPNATNDDGSCTYIPPTPNSLTVQDTNDPDPPGVPPLGS